jgi:hypothetical protein
MVLRPGCFLGGGMEWNVYWSGVYFSLRMRLIS